MKHFLVTVLVKIPEEIYKTWDSGCDETFGVIADIDDLEHQHVVSYREVPVDSVTDWVLTEEGGL